MLFLLHKIQFMIRKIFVYLILIHITAALSAQINISKDTILSRDSLVKINELKFTNNKEKEYYLKYVHSKDVEDAFHLLFYGENETINVDSILKIVNQHVAIVRDKMQNTSEKKQIKILYSYVHNNFFDKYLRLALFPDIFVNKEYNCLSASILYAYFLEKLKIPYEARLSDEHVYLVAYPNNLNIVLETTNPISKISNITDAFKREYINQMREFKLIGAQEFEQSTINDLFSKYYFEDNIVGFYDLIGAHYLNRTAILIDKFKFWEAYSLCLKAHVIDPSFKTIYLILYCGASKIQRDGYKTNEDVEILGELSRFTNYGINIESVVTDFNSITKTQLFDNSDTTMYNNSYKSLMYYFTDSTLKKTIGHSYYKALCLFNYQSAKMEKALYYIEKAFKISPNNKETERLLIEIFSNRFNHYNYSKNKSDLKAIYDKIESYIIIKPELVENSSFGIFRLAYWIELADNEFSKGNMSEGDKYLEQFEKLSTKEHAYMLNHDIQNVYVNGSFYYYKRYNNKKAKEYIERGLKILPDNYELNRRLKAL